MTLRLEDLMTRRSVPNTQLGEPAPDAEGLERILQVASRVPDHGKLVPFRFVELRGDARHALGAAMVARHREVDPDISESALEKDRYRFTHAPLIITVVGRMTKGHKVPEVEQLLSAGSVAFQLLQAAQAEGYRANWLTGWAAYDDEVRRWFGVTDDEVIVGFIHIGTPQIEVPERERPDAAQLLTEFDASRLPGDADA